MTCPKCAGLLVQEEMHEQSGRFHGWRCIQCGLRLDATIVQNRLRPQPGDAPTRCAGRSSDRFDNEPSSLRVERKRRPVAS